MKTAFSWDDLHLVLLLARGRTLAAAARQLGVDASTVHRRLAALEQRLDSSLFERGAGGYRPTAAGGELLVAAEGMAEAVQSLEERRQRRSDERLSGLVRVTAPDDLVSYILLPLIAGFLAEHPEVQIELAVDNRALNLSRREADVALRATREPPSHLAGRRASHLASAVYAAMPLAERPLASLPWIAWSEETGPPAFARWLEAEGLARKPVLRCGSMQLQAEAAAAGIGAVLLPCFLGDATPALRRLTPPLQQLASELWLLAPTEVRRRPVVRRFLDRAFAAVKAMRPRLEGRI
ncbi:MAG TPA: LysR family transcriptional regulator [Kiloniellales bacterium]|nr:LysR family transcriptional regulator [Kiloniellales bacterium]